MRDAKLSGKVALVTGASSGIGAATALALAAEGAAIAVAARRSARLDELVKRIEAQGGRAQAFVADLAIEKEATSMVQAARAAFGRIDILVNGAGVLGIGPLESQAPEEWRHMFEVNVLATLYTTQAALHAMRAAAAGHVVCVSSVLARAVPPGNTAYAMTKASLNSFAEGLRKELIKDNIRVTNVAPGAVATEIADHIRDPVLRRTLEERRQKIPMLQSEDVAAAIVYAVTQPAHVAINEILMRPAAQEF